MNIAEKLLNVIVKEKTAAAWWDNLVPWPKWYCYSCRRNNGVREKPCCYGHKHNFDFCVWRNC